ncbi:MAG TPA: Ig-like domain-containing protein [Flavobacteriales bacterium]|nr:Ig-like domain-containing protein [Flavobacteriales bacterium]
MNRSIFLYGVLLWMSLSNLSVLHAQPGPKPFERMKYQAVARDANGTPLADQTISLRLGIGFAISFAYQETQTVTTNAMGLFTVEVGDGTPTPLSNHPFEEIPWGQNTWWTFVVEMDPAGGTNYTMVGSEPILAAPYAHYADKARLLGDSAWVAASPTHVYTDHQVGIGTDAPSESLEVSGNAKVSSLFVGDGVFHDGTGARDMIIRMDPLQNIYFSLQSNGANEWEFRGNTSGDLRVFANFDQRLTLQQDGDMGLGTTAPETKLDVTGNVRIADAGNVNGPDPSAALEVASTTGAVLFPRLSTGQRDALTGTPGMVVYNTDDAKFQGFVTTFADSIGTQYDGPLGAYAVQLGGRPNGDLIAGGQSFQLSASGTLTALTLYNLNYFNLDAPADNSPRLVHIKILNGLPSDPGAAVLASTTIDLVPSNSGARTITFPQIPLLQAGTDYSFVIEPDPSSWDGTWWESNPSGTVPLQDASLYPNGVTYVSVEPYQSPPSYIIAGGPTISDFRFKVVLQIGTEEWIDLH